ncbi:MAG TPA: hypothetical protein VHB48_11865 [Chitinophagaceae bacterium]|nr:hypothetical protein [Chitinophagaceae bacterium]
MKKRFRGAVILLCGCALVLGMVIFVLVPRAAAITLPFRWGNIPLHQPKAIVHQYLGRPAEVTDSTDTWRAGRDNGEYQLYVTYAPDSSSVSYKIFFHYHLGFFHKQYLLVQK